ncbi:MAG: HAMP domain-containing sensor histidine kinase [Chthoniobacteraceae bacterium]
MHTLQKAADDELLTALTERLAERRGALQQSAEVLAEMRIVNAKLEAAERLKGRFLSNIRNEINNPLTTVRGLSAALANTPGLSRERTAGMAATIFREASDLSFQMQNIFVAADLEAGVAEPELGPVNLDELVAEIVGDFEPLAEHKGVSIITEAGDEIAAMMDRGKFTLILANLLRNAIEFARTKVVVRLSLADQILTLDVCDDGPGIPVEDGSRIFDRFVQLSEGSTKSHPGHGLGLSVARACAELLGGSIESVAKAEPGAHLRVVLEVATVAAGGNVADSASQFLFDAVETF